MNDISPAIRTLARQVVELESGQNKGTGEASRSAVRACERLREPLAQLMGVGGYYSLMSRTLAIARTEQPSLAAVRIRPDGTLDGLENSGQAREAAVAIMTHVLGLLVVFIGEPLALALVRENWPEARTDEMDGNEGDALEH